MATLTGYKSDRVGQFIEKDPFAVLDYAVDFTNWMPSGDTINAITVTVETIDGDAAPLAVDSSSKTDFVAKAFISGGTAGNIYNVEFRIITTNSLKDSRNFRIKVVERQV